MPSMVMMAVALCWTSITLALNVTASMVMPTPRMPVMIGMNAATSAPKATIMTMKAIAKPRSSATPPCSKTCISAPVPSTCSPLPRNSASRSVNCFMSSVVRSCTGMFCWISMMPTVPLSRSTCAPSAGFCSATRTGFWIIWGLVTSRSSRALATSASSCALCLARPSSAATRILVDALSNWSLVAGKSSDRMVSALSESVPGSSKSVANFGDKALVRAPSVMSVSTQTAMIHHLCRKLNRPSRYSQSATVPPRVVRKTSFPAVDPPVAQPTVVTTLGKVTP